MPPAATIVWHTLHVGPANFRGSFSLSFFARERYSTLQRRTAKSIGTAARPLTDNPTLGTFTDEPQEWFGHFRACSVRSKSKRSFVDQASAIVRDIGGSFRGRVRSTGRSWDWLEEGEPPSPANFIRVYSRRNRRGRRRRRYDGPPRFVPFEGDST